MCCSNSTTWLSSSVAARRYYSLGQKSLQIIRQWCREMQLVTAVIWKRDRLCVQEQAHQAKFSYALIVFLVTVTLIAR